MSFGSVTICGGSRPSCTLPCRLQQNFAQGDDRFIAVAKVLLGSIINRPHAFRRAAILLSGDDGLDARIAACFLVFTILEIIIARITNSPIACIDPASRTRSLFCGERHITHGQDVKPSACIIDGNPKAKGPAVILFKLGGGRTGNDTECRHDKGADANVTFVRPQLSYGDRSHAVVALLCL